MTSPTLDLFPQVGLMLPGFPGLVQPLMLAQAQCSLSVQLSKLPLRWWGADPLWPA